MLIVTKPFRYNTRALKVGDEFVAKSRRDSRLMMALGRIKLVEEEAKTVKAAPDPEPPVVVEAKVEEPKSEVVEEPKAEVVEEPKAEVVEEVKPAKAEEAKKPGRPKKDT